MTKNPRQEFPQTDRGEILHLLKYGRGGEARVLAAQSGARDCPDGFVPFMDRMIAEHGISRKNVAVRSGLSQDYVYKLLRGDKHTDERDYILAMCFAIGMDLAQTQRALSSYGMPLLSEGDPRARVILLALRNRDGMDTLNRMLESAGFPLLRTSPDMPRAPITDTAPAAPARPEPRALQALDSFTDARRGCGNAPFDYDYVGRIRVMDETGRVFLAEGVYTPDGALFTVRRADLPGGTDAASVPLETYQTIEDTAASAFFPFFLEIDKNTDQKVREVLDRLDDTREYGWRVGSGLDGGGARNYIELFNDREPEKREYFQLVEHADGTCRYTASHESCFMRIELGPALYPVCFGARRREPEYFIDTDRNDFSGGQVRYRFLYNWMRLLMHERLLKTGGFLRPDPRAVKEERARVLIEQASRASLAGSPREALPFLREAAEALEELGAPEPPHLAAYVCTLDKLAVTLRGLGDPEADGWTQKILALKEAVKAATPADPKAYGGALSALAEAVMDGFRRAMDAGDRKSARTFLEEALDLTERFHAADGEWETRFEIRSNLAYLLEQEDTEAALREYRAALALARNHHLDQDKRCALAVAVQYNNLAWVLWNMCQSEEAVIFYGRAIDLLESYLFSGIVDRDTVLKELKHVGAALNGIYARTGRARESEYLKRRLAENGVIPD